MTARMAEVSITISMIGVYHVYNCTRTIEVGGMGVLTSGLRINVKTYERLVRGHIADIASDQLPYSHARRHRNSDLLLHQHSRPARHHALLQRMAAGSRHAHVDEQSRRGRSRAPSGSGRLRRHGQG